MSFKSSGSLVSEEGIIGALPAFDTYDKDVSPSFAERDYRDHRQVYVGLHHISAEKPLKKANKLPKFALTQPPKSFRWENGKKLLTHIEESASEAEGQDGYVLPPPPASERVKFILGGSNAEDEEETKQGKPQLFTELEELCVHWDGNLEWKETARWYKYEENVEEGGDRWSKPHVATLSLYSVFELRSSLMAGTVILDMEANSLADIADNVLDNLISCNKLEEIFRAKVYETLLRKHRHQRSCGFRRNLSNIIGSRKSFNMLSHSSSHNMKVNGSIPNGNATELKDLGSPKDNQPSDFNSQKPGQPKLFRNFSQPAFSTNVALRPHVTYNRADSAQGHLVYPTASNSGDEETSEKMPAFLKKLPPNAEASNILVGEVDFLEKPITAFVRLANSSVIGDLTEVPIPTRFLFIMLGPCLAPKRYHEIGRAISTLMADEVFHDVAYKAKSRDDLIAGIDEFLEQVIVLPPGEWDPSIRIDPPVNGVAKFSRRQNIDNKNIEIPPDTQSGGSETGDSTDGEQSSSLVVKRKIFNGLIRDFEIWKSRLRDISDGLNLKCIHAVFFLYILMLSLTVILGEHHSSLTGNTLGRREYLLSLGILGILYSLFSTQPLLIISLTCPLILFDGVLFKFCEDYYINFLSFRFWTGIWTIVLLIIFIAFNLSNFIYYITRFSIEIFVVLSPLAILGLTFIKLCEFIQKFSLVSGAYTNLSCYCIKNVTYGNASTIIRNGSFRDCLFEDDWTFVGEACSHDYYPFSLLLTLCTIALYLFLTSFQHFGYLPSQLHQFFHNSAGLVVLLVLSIVANQFDVQLTYLKLPTSFQPSSRTSWVVPIFDKEKFWIIFAAIVPAMLLTMIIFVEQQFTACHINRKSRILKKRFGYHLDMLIIAIGVGLSAVLGLPYCVASVILSINHVQSLTTKSSDGDFIGAFITVHEQRVSGLLVSVLLLLTPLMTPALKYIPIAVLYGIFVMALLRIFKGIQFAKRFLLLFMPKTKQPDLIYLRQVPLISANVFTVVQVLCTIILWAIRASKAAIVFPIFMFTIHLVRYLLEYILPIRDILVLDEPMRTITLFRKRQKREENIFSDLENGKLLSDEAIHEDVIYDHNKASERVNISEELSKTAAWKQLMKDEVSNSPISNSPSLERKGSRKRRKSRRKSSGDVPKVRTATFLLDQTDSQFKKTNDKNLRKKDSNADYKDRKERKNSSRKRKKSRDHSTKEHHHRKAQHEFGAMEEPPPPWEQPYHSPPRRDFGLLKIPVNDCSVDPACSRSESPPSDQGDFSKDSKENISVNSDLNNRNKDFDTPPSPDESKSRDASSENEEI